MNLSISAPSRSLTSSHTLKTLGEYRLPSPSAQSGRTSKNNREDISHLSQDFDPSTCDPAVVFADKLSSSFVLSTRPRVGDTHDLIASLTVKPCECHMTTANLWAA
jgi:hypothetical protein